LCEDLSLNLTTTLAIPNSGFNDLLFSIAVAIKKPETTRIFRYLWDKFPYIWEYHHLQTSIELSFQFNRRDLLVFLLESTTTHSFFLSFSNKYRLKFIRDFMAGQ
jgi:hypothetical protein